MDGFDAGDKVIPVPPVAVSEAVRGRLVEVLAAVVQGFTPEEISELLTEGLSAAVAGALERAGEREEMSAHVDLFLTVLQSPVPA